MEGTESNSPVQQEDSQITIAETIAGYVEFQECVEDILEEIEEDEKFSEMTAENYDKKKSYLRKNLNEVSSLHTLLFDQHVRLIDEVSKNCPSRIKKNHLDSSDSSSKRESSDSGSESTNKLLSSPVKDDALKVREELKDSGFEPVVLCEKISNLEEEVANLKHKLQSLTIENGELKMEIEENIADASLYVSETKLETETMKKELKLRKETEISQLKSEYEKKEKIWNGVTGKLKNDLKEKCELVDELSKKLDRKDEQLDILWAEKRSDDVLIHQLKTKLDSVKFDNIQKLTDEMKLKEVETGKELDKRHR